MRIDPTPTKMSPGGLPSYYLTLVHGTWAPATPWVNADWPFRIELDRCIDNRATYEPFVWSGENTHEARRAAARRLSQQLREAVAQHSGARHFIIAHSHGGNIARYALEDAVLAARVEGLVCMSTPFVECQSRRVKDMELLRSVMRVSVRLLPFLGWIPLVGLYFWIEDWAPGMLERVHPGTAFAGVLTLFVGLLLGTRALFAHLDIRDLSEGELSRRQRDILKELVPPELPHLRCLCVTSALDEPLWWLRFSRSMAEVPYALYRIARIAVIGSALLAGSTFIVTSFVSMVLDGSNGSAAAQRAREEWIASTLAPLLIALAVSACVLVIASVLMPVLTILRSHRLGFGEHVRDSLLVNVSVRATPRAVGQVDLVYQPLKRGIGAYMRLLEEGLPLLHSAVYADPLIVRAIANWLTRSEQAKRSFPNEPAAHS